MPSCINPNPLDVGVEYRYLLSNAQTFHRVIHNNMANIQTLPTSSLTKIRVKMSTLYWTIWQYIN